MAGGGAPARARALGSETDTLLLTELRTLADAVLIGSGTLRAEGYGRMVGDPGRVARREAAGLAPTPTAVLLSRSLDLPWGAGLFAAAGQPVVAYTGSDAEPPDVAATLEVALLAAGVVDELFLTLSPLLAGNADAPRIVEGEDLPGPVALQLAWMLRHGDELYLRYRLA